MAVRPLIDSLEPEKTDEHNMNASAIILDLLEEEDFYNMILHKDNLSKIVEFALAGIYESTK